MLPSHGAVTSVFFLANSLRHTSYVDVSTWVEAAGAGNSFLAAAIDHLPAAEYLLQRGLVLEEEEIATSRRLHALSRAADRPTLLAIANLLFELSPPGWLSIAVHEGRVREEFIPQSDLQSLEWLRPDLHDLLLGVAQEASARRQGAVALGLGFAAEMVVLAALEEAQLGPLHVAEISDRYGYDIETQGGTHRRWEVKGATTATSTSFHLTRNEFDKCAAHHDWVLAQVVFSSAALFAETVLAHHIEEIRLLMPSQLVPLSPMSSPSFMWESSALFVPPRNAWVPSALVVPSGFALPGMKILGEGVIAQMTR
jgi:hypothetical protein